MLSMSTGLAAGAARSDGIEPKRMSTGLARKSAMLAGMMMPWEDAIELHEELPITPT